MRALAKARFGPQRMDQLLDFLALAFYLLALLSVCSGHCLNNSVSFALFPPSGPREHTHPGGIASEGSS